jgi:hypothetical protein
VPPRHFTSIDSAEDKLKTQLALAT